MLYRLENVEKSYGPHDVLQGATWQHNPGEHVGLVGRNGAGKTTLFRLVLKTEDPDHGTIVRASGLRVGHLSQHLDADPETTLFDFVLSAFSDVLAIEKRMREIEHDLADPERPDHDRLLEKYSELQHDYEHADGYTLHSEVERVLTGVGFEKDVWQKSIHQFSGGQQNRAMLARVLLTKVDVLLLDEPTNHLDLHGIEFLEEFLQSYRGSYLIISHDRTFLNRTVTKIVELAHGKILEYNGNYDRFIQQRGERHERMRVEYERQQEYIEKTQDFIRRNIAGQKTKQAKSRRNMLERIDELARPETDETLARFSLDAGPRSGVIALTADHLTVGYEKKPVVRDLSLTVRRGERYAIMGPNGSGKSTVLKTLAGKLSPISGDLHYGHNLQLGYYDQTLGDLSPQGKVLDEIWNLDHSQTEEEVRNYLARFSFFGEDVEKTVKNLSGGEKGRLALAKIMYSGGNLMLLDEPTNHLDVYTREALEDALGHFTGALIVVSHDRYFIDRLAQNIVLVEESEATVHHGNYSDLVAKFKAEASLIESNRSTRPAQVARLTPPDSSDDQRKRERRMRKIDEAVSEAERRLALAEGEKGQNDVLLCQEDVYRDGARSRAIHDANAAVQTEIDELYQRLEELLRERESLSAVRA